MAGEDDDSPFREDPAKAQSEALEQLGDRFLSALAHKDAGKTDKAEEMLRALVAEEPRLAEPRLELARVLLDTDRLSEAEDQAREGLEQLDRSGIWVEEVPENVVRALAHALLAEILRRKADEDDVIFGDPAAFKAILDESREQFAKAAALDPSDEFSSYHAFFLGVPGAQISVGPGDDGKDDDEGPVGEA